MSPPFANGDHSRLADIGGSVEIGFANLEVNHVPALGFERPGTDENFKRGFRPEALHSGRESHLTTFDFTSKCMVTARAAELGCKHNGAAVCVAPRCQRAQSPC